MDQPCNVYREQLSSLYHGYALWEPDPVKGLYDKVSIGDVGYVDRGFFYRMFNVTFPWDHPSNKKLGELEYYKPLDWGQFLSIHTAPFDKGNYNTPNVTGQENIGNTLARSFRECVVVLSHPGATSVGSHSRSTEGITYRCEGPGALLSIPHDGCREDVIRTKVFEDYIRDNVVSWFEWSKKIGLGVEHMEDLILVTGCTLVTSWVATAFLGRSREAKVSLVQMQDNSERSFEFSNIQGDVARHCSRFDPVCSLYYVWAL
jgi:hypothetical protein